MKPKAPIRRFDVFAEYNRQEAMKDGAPADEAAGYGLWVAKVVASRRFGGGALSQKPPKPHEAVGEGGGEGQEEQKPKSKWRTLDGKPQTEELFEQEIIERMGRDFYYEVFSPAIEKALQENRSYTSIRDTIRRDWKP